MKVIYDVGKIDRTLTNAVLAIGVFDGLHLGHQKLIKAAVKKAKKMRVPAVVMTFFPHPVQVLHPNCYLPFIVSLSHRLRLIKQLGVKACLVIPFTKKISQLTAGQFVKKYLIRLFCPQEVYVGADFCFGKNRQGTVSYLMNAGQKYGFKVNAVAPVKAGNRKIGSSSIRHLIMRGRLNEASRLLGRNVSLMGKVVKGEGRGKSLGFPTANIFPENEMILPVGVYAVRVKTGHRMYKGMANVGRRPSFKKNKNHINIEIHIFEFKKSLYGKEISVEFIKKIRNEKFFKSPQELTDQLARDTVTCKTILKSR
ncbi:MAG: bifunctional riboflavin kinase/FAD synthetase [Candidatus Omnitrophica bacterium]|nr:bifunctional riboflavin kinase/FAD synthetase [Candidatus Omnitrophota bacterium]